MEIERPGLPSEIGCYASHLALWKQCVALDETIVILEDDFLADDKLPDSLKFIEPHADRLGFVRLEPVSYRNEYRNNLDSTAELDDGTSAIHPVTKKFPRD